MSTRIMTAHWVSNCVINRQFLGVQKKTHRNTNIFDNINARNMSPRLTISVQRRERAERRAILYYGSWLLLLLFDDSGAT